MEFVCTVRLGLNFLTWSISNPKQSNLAWHFLRILKWLSLKRSLLPCASWKWLPRAKLFVCRKFSSSNVIPSLLLRIIQKRALNNKTLLFGVDFLSLEYKKKIYSNTVFETITLQKRKKNAIVYTCCQHSHETLMIILKKRKIAVACDFSQISLTSDCAWS